MIKLSHESIELLKKCVQNQDNSLMYLLEEQKLSNLKKEQYNLLRELVCDELIREGFENENITQYGIQLEKLIDELGHMFM